MLDRQLPDGSWQLTWNWADVDAHAWAEAEPAWRGVIILERLRTLRAYGRI